MTRVMYANATRSVLVVSGARKGNTAGILRGDAYTPIPWSVHTVTAAWQRGRAPRIVRTKGFSPDTVGR